MIQEQKSLKIFKVQQRRKVIETQIVEKMVGNETPERLPHCCPYGTRVRKTKKVTNYVQLANWEKNTQASCYIIEVKTTVPVRRKSEAQ